MAKSGFDTRMYFDKKAVMDVVGKARVAVLARQGALVRKIMKNSMRKKKGPAKAGDPPNAHQGNLKKIEFAFDPKRNDVVVGPAALGKGIVPKLQNEGGTVKVRGIVNRKGEFVPLRLMSRQGRQGAVASGKVVVQNRELKARPFTEPALKKAKPLLAKEWKGKVKK